METHYKGLLGQEEYLNMCYSYLPKIKCAKFGLSCLVIFKSLAD